MGQLMSNLSEDARTYKEMHKEGQTPEGSGFETPSTPSPVFAGGDKLLNSKVAELVDPRSPTQGVSRTPLEIEERNRRIERTRLKNQFNKENNLSVPQTTLFPTVAVEGADPVTTPTGPPQKDFPFGFDPRSPNPEINRTPIALEQQQRNAQVVARKMFQQSQENGLE